MLPPFNNTGDLPPGIHGAAECRTLFAHPDAEARFGASVFWIREGMLPKDLMREFLDTWQIKRDGAKRGIVEITP